MTAITRELLPRGVRLSSGDATFQFARPRPAALLVTRPRPPIAGGGEKASDDALAHELGAMGLL